MKKTAPLHATGIAASKISCSARLGLLLSATFLLSQSLHAGTATWNGAGSSWATASNWTGNSGSGTTPTTAADDVVLDNRNVTLSGTISLDGSQNANSLTIGSSSGAPLGAFTLEANSGTTTARTLTLASGSITLDSSVTGTATIGNSTNGVLSIATVTNGAFTIQNNNTTQTLDIAGAIIKGTGTNNATFNSAGGTIILAGGNTANGTAMIGNGSNHTVVQIGNAAALSSFSSRTVNAGSTVDLNGTALTSSSFTLNGAGNGSGVNAGALVNSVGTASDAGVITLGSAATIKNSGTSLTLSGAVNNGGFLLTVDGSGATTLGTGIMSGSGGVNMIGSGTLTLSGANTFGGGLSVSNGTVILGNTAGAGTAAVTLGSSTGGSAALLASNNNVTYANAINLATNAVGTLTIGNSGASNVITFSGAIALNGDTLTLASGGTGSTRLSGIISGTGGLTINNSTTTSTSFVTGTNTFAGAVNVTAGTLSLGTASALGAATNTLTLSAGTTIDASVTGVSSTNPVTVLGSFTFGATNPLTISGALTMPSGNATVTIGTGGAAVGRVLTLGNTSLGGSTLTVQGNIAAAAGTTASGLTLGTVSLTGNQIFNVINSSTGNVTQLQLGTVSDGGSGDSLTKNGSGTLYLFSTTNSIGGAITVNAGALDIDGASITSSLGTGTITINGGGIGRMDLGGTQSVTTNAIIIGANDTASFFGSGGGIMFSGGLTVGSGATISNQNPNATTSKTVVFSGTTTLGGNLTLSAPQGSLTFNGPINDAASTSHDGITISSTGAGNVVTLSSAASTFDGGVTLTSGALALGGTSTLSGTAVTSGGAGTGTLTLNGGSIGFAAGSTTISNTLVINGTVEFGGSGSAGNGLASNAITFGGATTIAANSILTSPTSGTTTLNSVAFNSAVIPLSTVTLGGNITVEPSSTSKFIFDDAIGDGGGGFGITIGNGTTTGTVVLGSNTTNPNTYSGATTVLSGTLDVAATQALNNSTLVTSSTAGSTIFDSTVSSHAFTFGGLSGSGNLALQDNAGTPNAVALSVGNNNTSTTYSGTLSGGGSLTKIGTGALTLSGSNSYSGATLVQTGTLNVTGSLGAGSAVTVGNNTAVATLAGNGTINGSLAIAATTSFAAHVAPGAVAGQVGTLHVGSLGFSVGSGTNFDFDLGATLGNTSEGGAFNDEIAMAGGTLNFGGSVFFNFDALTALSTTGTYTLINDSAGTITGFSAANFHASGTGGDVATFSVVGNELVVTFSSGGTESTQYYYTGGTSHDFTLAGNFNDAASAGNVHVTGPGATSDVFIAANSPANLPPTVGTNTITINSLSFTSAGAGSSLNGTGTVTLAAASGQGLTDNAGGSGTETVNANLALGSNQNWTVTGSNDTQAVAGAISGAHALTLTGPGSFNFTNGTSSYSGGTTVNAGARLLINNTSGTTALGSGPLVVAAGGTFGGKGTATGMSSFAIGGTGSPTTLQVGAGGNDTSSVLTLGATSASTITNTTLTFNLSTTGGGNELALGSTAISFSGDTLALNLVGSNIIAANTPYVLITDSNGFASAGLGLSDGSSGLVTTNLIIGSSLYFGPGTSYANSFLFVSADGKELEVEVVPEPGTWALLVSGLACLIFWQRRSRKQS